MARTLRPIPCSFRVRFNVPDGGIGLRAVDGISDTIAFCPPELISRARVKPTARLVSRIEVSELDDPTAVIEAANLLLAQWREQTKDILLTAFKGLRADGRYRRRLDFGTARVLLSHALYITEQHAPSPLAAIDGPT